MVSDDSPQDEENELPQNLLPEHAGRNDDEREKADEGQPQLGGGGLSERLLRERRENRRRKREQEREEGEEEAERRFRERLENFRLLEEDVHRAQEEFRQQADALKSKRLAQTVAEVGITALLSTLKAATAFAIIYYFIYSFVNLFSNTDSLKEFLDLSGINKSKIFSVAASISLIILYIYLLISDRTKSETEGSQLSKLQVEREKITRKIEKDTTPDIFYTIQLSLNQLTEYYTINKGQARNSFNFSIGAASAGFLTLLVGIWFYYFKVKDVPVTYLTGTAGFLLEFIGGAYFFIYKKSLEQVNLFFGQLIKIQDTMLAIDLARHNNDPVRRSDLEEKIIVSLLERSLK